MDKNTIISIVLLAVCCLIYGGMVFYNKYIMPKKAEKKKNESKLSANVWTNVDDIDEAIFTSDGYAISVFRIFPVNIDLMTNKEKNDFVREISASISPLKTPYKLLAVPQPYDAAPYIDALQEQKSESSNIKKQIISDEIAYISGMVSTGTMVEKRFYIVTWSKKIDDWKRDRDEFISRWNESRRIDTAVLKTEELIALCNLIFNPSVRDENYDNIYTSAPLLKK